MERNFYSVKGTLPRISSKHSPSSLRHVPSIPVPNHPPDSILIDMAMAWHYRGKCYQGMGDFQRALYDFTCAIRLDTQQGADPKV
jgi:hypothetical protein